MTIGFLNSLDPERINGSEERDITFKIGGASLSQKGEPYLLHNALMHFLFHVTTAYDILRHCGVGIGKKDFIGSL